MVVVATCHGVPVLGKVDQVLMIDGEVVILQYKRLQVLEFITHLNAYKVLELDEMACVKQKDLKDFHPLSLCKGFGQFAQGCFVVLRYSVYCV